MNVVKFDAQVKTFSTEYMIIDSAKHLYLEMALLLLATNSTFSKGLSRKTNINKSRKYPNKM